MRSSFTGLLALMGCTGAAPTVVDPDPPTEVVDTDDTDVPVDTDTDTDVRVDDLLSTCVFNTPSTHGTLCALQPSVLDPATQDIYSDATVPDSIIGFGYHTIAIPAHPDPTKPLWVHFGGTYGRPFDPTTNTFGTSQWLSELMEQGYTVIQPAYSNRRAVNDDCAATAPGADRDNCAGEIREEVLTGVDLSPYREVNAANSVDYRMRTLLRHVDQHANLLPTDLDPEALDWSRVRVSGHSQGGNLAYYIARFRGVQFACMLGSPYDVADNVDRVFPFIADWFKEGTPLTDVPNLGQVITEEDENYTAFHGAAVFLGLTLGVDAFEISDPPYTDGVVTEITGHAASVGDPDLRGLRAQACFR